MALPRAQIDAHHAHGWLLHGAVSASPRVRDSAHGCMETGSAHVTFSRARVSLFQRTVRGTSSMRPFSSTGD